MSEVMVPEPGESLEALRAAAQRVTSATSLRHVAGLVGMSPEGLRRFLEGSTPAPQTRRKLVRLSRMEAVEEDGMADAPARAALSYAVAHLPAAERYAAVEELRAVVARRSRAAGVPVPGWAAGGTDN
ncbi:MAG TPA: hypothetical protein VFQ76_10700 [Longimicrobiaceae bacterium]|nr:hypothetical protein [Longimicrobiaceae bacterium]